MAFKTKLSVLALSGLMMSAAPVHAQSSFDASQKAAIEQIVKEYLLENGEVVLQSVDAFRQQETKAQEAKAKQIIASSLDTLASADAPSVGDPNADVTVIEFFDYNCGYCKRATADVQDLVKTEKNVRFVFREMPILGPSSLEASKWSLAAHKQGKYFEYHTALMNHRGSKTTSEYKKMGKKIGLDTAQLEKDANSQEVAAQIDADLAVSRSIGINGTPAFIIGGELFPGYLGKDGLKSSIEKARKKDG